MAGKLLPLLVIEGMCDSVYKADGPPILFLNPKFQPCIGQQLQTKNASYCTKQPLSACNFC